MKTRSAYILGFLSALGIVTLCLAAVVVYVANQTTELLAEAFSTYKDVEVEMKFEVSEPLDLSPLVGGSLEELAAYLAQGDQEKEKQYHMVLSSGLNVSVSVEYENDETLKTQKIYVEDGSIANTSFSSSMNSKVVWKSEETSLKGIKSLIEETKKESKQDDPGTTENPGS